jgi:hypothetical protein
MNGTEFIAPGNVHFLVGLNKGTPASSSAAERLVVANPHFVLPRATVGAAPSHPPAHFDVISSHGSGVKMQPDRSSVVPVVLALIIAIVGIAILLNMDFGPRTAVRNDGLNKISRQAISKAGAMATPTVQEDE